MLSLYFVITAPIKKKDLKENQLWSGYEKCIRKENEVAAIYLSGSLSYLMMAAKENLSRVLSNEFLDPAI